MLLLNKKRAVDQNNQEMESMPMSLHLPTHQNMQLSSKYPNTQRNISNVLMKKDFTNNFSKLQNLQKKIKTHFDERNENVNMQNCQGQISYQAISKQLKNYQDSVQNEVQVKIPNFEKIQLGCFDEGIESSYQNSCSNRYSRASTQVATIQNSQLYSNEPSGYINQNYLQRPSLGSRKGSLTSLVHGNLNLPPKQSQVCPLVLKQGLSNIGAVDQIDSRCSVGSSERRITKIQFGVQQNAQNQNITINSSNSQRSQLNENQSMGSCSVLWQSNQQSSNHPGSAKLTPVINLNKIRKNTKLESLVLNQLAEEQIAKTQQALTSRQGTSISQNHINSLNSSSQTRYIESIVQNEVIQNDNVDLGSTQRFENASIVIRKKSNKSVYQSPARNESHSRQHSVNQSPRVSREKLIFTADRRRGSTNSCNNENQKLELVNENLNIEKENCGPQLQEIIVLAKQQQSRFNSQAKTSRNINQNSHFQTLQASQIEIPRDSLQLQINMEQTIKQSIDLNKNLELNERNTLKRSNSSANCDLRKNMPGSRQGVSKKIVLPKNNSFLLKTNFDPKASVKKLKIVKTANGVNLEQIENKLNDQGTITPKLINIKKVKSLAQNKQSNDNQQPAIQPNYIINFNISFGQLPKEEVYHQYFCTNNITNNFVNNSIANQSSSSQKLDNELPCQSQFLFNELQNSFSQNVNEKDQIINDQNQTQKDNESINQRYVKKIGDQDYGEQQNTQRVQMQEKQKNSNCTKNKNRVNNEFQDQQDMSLQQSYLKNYKHAQNSSPESQVDFEEMRKDLKTPCFNNYYISTHLNIQPQQNYQDLDNNQNQQQSIINSLSFSRSEKPQLKHVSRLML